MIRELALGLSPEQAADKQTVRRIAASLAGLSVNDISEVFYLKRSIDARKKNIRVNLKVRIVSGEDTYKNELQLFRLQQVNNKPEVLIAGSGPAGLFASLQLIEEGYRPLLFERGLDVHTRKKDIAQLNRDGSVNIESNYCFGEGGAGTFSDGKLYTRSVKRGNIRKVTDTLFQLGAPEEILYDSHPHIGTDKLPSIVEKIRNIIIDCGGIVRFSSRITDIITDDGRVSGIVLAAGERISGNRLILATGNSASDIYSMLDSKGIVMQAKPTAMGVRIEHPQELIDRIQYHGIEAGKFLPPASYSLTAQAHRRGVFSFCMCPGGYIVPSATAGEQCVVNGMSPSRRNSPFANSGIVVEIREEDYAEFSDDGALAGIHFRNYLEKMAFQNGNGLKAPAQRVTDFLDFKPSQNLPESSYLPGLVCSPLHEWLPKFIRKSLAAGIMQFDQKMKGFITSDAIITGVESRTSSPVKIPRNEQFMHPTVNGLYPCGEGAGHAGGIVSSAIDGMNAAIKLAEYM